MNDKSKQGPFARLHQKKQSKLDQSKRQKQVISCYAQDHHKAIAELIKQWLK
tara:strand:+ start:22556 stop:22711 length:156 start_codon:yes stop_codon:yes gene_type:complete